MKHKWKQLIVCLLLPVAAGAVSSLVSADGMQAFSELNKPPLSPPGWLFPPVWTVLYLLMGLASWFVLKSEASEGQVRSAWTAYILQLAVNVLWAPIFFGAGLYLLSFIWLILLWGLIVAAMIRFYDIRQAAGELLLPYLLWVTFAGYLNLGVWLLNK